MTKKKIPFRQMGLALAVSAAIPLTGYAESDLEGLQKQINQLEKQLDTVEKQLNETKGGGAAGQSPDTQDLQQQIDAAAEWKYPDTLIHMSGYADVGYTDGKDSDGDFNVGTFAPIFHFQYRDIILLESELEFKVKADGETDVALEYLTLDWFINDYTVLVAGKFLSPIGQFRQNLHPSWINKLPSPPPGFGHDGAAPTSELGFQFRGGFPMGKTRATYAVYASNGPELNSVTEDLVEYELEGIKAEGFGADRDGKKTYGGRFSILPISSVEVGLSAATGKASVTEIIDELTPGKISVVGTETARDYDVLGADVYWGWKGLVFRCEYVQTKIGAASTGLSASTGSKWETWYTQFAYRVSGTKWEPVIRYTDFDSPHPSEDQKQTALGINYIVTNNFITKLAYEFNDGQTNTGADEDRILLQMAYGF